MRIVACLGSGLGQSGDAYYDAMVDVGRLLAKRRVRVATGGFGGVGMEAPSKGASQAKGKARGYIWLGRRANEYCSEIMDCSFMQLNGRALSAEEQYGIRLGGLLSADGFIIASGGGAGALVELLAIMNLSQRIWAERPKRTAVLRLPDVPVAWDSDICDMLYRWGYVSPCVPPLICTVSSAKAAVDWVLGPRKSRGVR